MHTLQEEQRDVGVSCKQRGVLSILVQSVTRWGAVLSSWEGGSHMEYLSHTQREEASCQQQGQLEHYELIAVVKDTTPDSLWICT